MVNDRGIEPMFYLIRKGQPLTDREGGIRTFANVSEMGKLQRGDQPRVYHPGQPPR